MPELTADVVLRKIKTGEKVERADLRGLVLTQAVLEGASFRRCDLDGANLEGARLAKALFKNASLREAFLANADMREANLENADMEGANLQGAKLTGANLNRVNLEGANLQGADLSGARLTHAQLESAQLGGARLVGALLAHADLTETDLSTAKLDDADLSSTDLTEANLEEASLVRAQLRETQLTDAILTRADFSGADLRRANIAGAKLEGANFTGARVHGLVGTGTPLTGVRADWLDNSAEGTGASRITGADALAALSGRALPLPAHKRYFGRGDVLRNAHLEFDAGAAVEIESLFERCTIALGDGTELVVGKGGTLSGCQIVGAGRVTIHGKFVEHESPGIVGATQVVVSAGGSLVGAVEQPPEMTRFAFEPGCMLRVKIQQARKTESQKLGGRDDRTDEGRARPQDAGGRRNALQGVAHVELPDRSERSRRRRLDRARAGGEPQRGRPRAREGRRDPLARRAGRRVRRRCRPALGDGEGQHDHSGEVARSEAVAGRRQDAGRLRRVQTRSGRDGVDHRSRRSAAGACPAPFRAAESRQRSAAR